MLSYSNANPRDFILDGPPLEAINDTLWFSLVGGDARLSNLVLETVEAPLAVATYVDVQYPTYLQRSTKTTWGNERLEFRNGMRLPQGTQVGFWIRANKPIRKCDVMQVRGVESQDSTTQFTVELEKPVTEFAIPSTVLLGNLFVEIRLWDDQGLCATRVQPLVIAATSEPASGSDSANAASIFPRATWGKYFCFSASEPNNEIGPLPSPCMTKAKSARPS
jgi:hypothetical protein